MCMQTVRVVETDPNHQRHSVVHKPQLARQKPHRLAQAGFAWPVVDETSATIFASNPGR